MITRLLPAALALVLAGCASAPVYEYRATASPLLYEFSGNSDNQIETPGGMQTSGGETEATVVVSIEAAADSGTVFSAKFDAFRAAATGGAGGGELSVEDVEGATFRALLRRSGAVDILDAPDIAAEGISTDDLAGVVIGLLMPLPPGGSDPPDSWPHTVESPVGSGLEGLTKYTGVARLAGDTTWNGVSAQVIVSEGKWVLSAAGTPPGSPTEIELVMEGTTRTTYLWDSKRGVMLGAEAVSSGKGNVNAMGFEMPISNTGSSTITLQTAGSGSDDGE